MRKYIIIISMGLVMSGFIASSAMAQEEMTQDKDAAQQAEPAAAAVTAAKAEEVSIYGEIGTVDAVAGTLIAQYYNYDSDEEKSIGIVVDKDTKIENAASLGEINKGDWADITYIAVEGKNTAKLIVVEREEEPISAIEEGTPPALEELEDPTAR